MDKILVRTLLEGETKENQYSILIQFGTSSSRIESRWRVNGDNVDDARQILHDFLRAKYPRYKDEELHLVEVNAIFSPEPGSLGDEPEFMEGEEPKSE